MRQIGTLPDQHQADRLVDHLLTLAISGRVLKEPQGWSVWVHDEDQVDDARREFDAFVRDPDDPRYQAAAQAARALRKEAAHEEKAYRKNFVDMRQRWDGSSPLQKPLTLALVAACVAVMVLPSAGVPSRAIVQRLAIAPYVRDPGGLIQSGGLTALAHGEVWRLFTPILLHAGLVHLLINLYWLALWGSIIETRAGPLTLALLVLVSAAASNYAQYCYDGPAFGGLTSVNFALFGYVWMKGVYDPASRMRLHPTIVYLMLAWLVVCVAHLVGPAADVAHLVGLGVGMLWGMAPRMRWRGRANP